MKRGVLKALGLFFLLLFFASASFGAKTICSQPVKTEQGLVKGYADAEFPVCVWKGIPYAQPSIGELRLRPPHPPKPYNGVLEAYEVAPACPQAETIFAGGSIEEKSEDCLYLNIWRPKKPGKFPVMVWIHGGGFRQGSGGYSMYDGARLSAEYDVVVVTINYRLGALGWIALPELAEEDPNHTTGNYGLLDQIQALKWIQKNISAFGGDPNNVTLFGQSAGGMSTCALLASPLAKGLFHRAIPMSGSCADAEPLEEAYKMGRRMVEKIGCKGEGRELLACLRKKPAKDFVFKIKNTVINAMKGGLTFGIKIDGYVLEKQPIEYFKEGNFNKMPVMIGHTRDEIKLYTMLIPGTSLWSKWSVNWLLKKLLGEYYEEVMSMYSYSDYRRPSHLLFAVCDEAFISRGVDAAEALSRYVPVYLYRFDWDETKFPRKMGAFHSLDVPFVFGHFTLDSDIAKLLANKKIVKKAKPLSRQIMAYYTNFAKNGDPNGEGLIYWPAYTPEKKQRIIFDTPISVKPIGEDEFKRYSYFSQFYIMGMKLEKKE